MPYSTFIFDYDGTLADTISIFAEVVDAIKADYGHKDTKTQQLSYYRRKDMKQLLKDFGIRKWQIPGLVKKVHQRLQLQVDRIHYFSGFQQVLQKLTTRNIKLGVVSSNDKETIHQFLTNQDFNNFSFIYGGVAIFGKHRKLSKVLKQENLDKEKVLYFGDQVRDVEACQKIGLDVCAVSWGFNTKEKLQESNPDYLIDKPSQVLDLIGGKAGFMSHKAS